MYMEYLEKQQDQDRLVSQRIVKSAKCSCLQLTSPCVSGIFVMQLPDDQFGPFMKWLYAQPHITILGQPFAYATDYDRWYETWIKE